LAKKITNSVKHIFRLFSKKKKIHTIKTKPVTATTIDLRNCKTYTKRAAKQHHIKVYPPVFDFKKYIQY